MSGSEAMRPEDIEELLGAYALDAVDPDERAIVEQYLATHPRSRAEVVSHQEVATLLGFTGASAPEGLWDRIAVALEEGGVPEPGPELAKVLPIPTGPRPTAPPTTTPTTTPTAPPTAPGSTATRPAAPPSASRPAPIPPPPTTARIRPWARAGIAAAAVAAVAAAVIVPLSTTVRNQNDRIDALEELDDGAWLERDYAELVADPATHVATLDSEGTSGTDETMTVPAAVGADGRGYLRGEGLPSLPAGQTYQLWGVTGDRVVSLGVLGSDPSLEPFQADAGTAALAVTAEDEGGVAVSQNAPVVLGTLA